MTSGRFESTGAAPPGEVRNDSFIRSRHMPRDRWLLKRCVKLVLAFGGLAILLAWVLRHDHTAVALADPMLADVPASWLLPFGETRSDAQLRRTYREPPPIEAIVSTTIPSARQPRGLEGIPDTLQRKLLVFYGTRCASCHGSTGDGKGPASEMIKPAPRSFRDKVWQQSVTDEQLTLAIVKGGSAVGKSYLMPASIDLQRKPEMTQALVQLVRSFAD